MPSINAIVYGNFLVLDFFLVLWFGAVELERDIVDIV